MALGVGGAKSRGKGNINKARTRNLHFLHKASLRGWKLAQWEGLGTQREKGCLCMIREILLFDLYGIINKELL